MKRASRCGICVGAGIVLSVGTLGGTYLLLPRDRLLLQEATKVCSVNNGSRSPVIWLTERDLILVSYRQGGDRFELVKRNTGTGEEKSLDALNRRLGSYLKASSITFPRVTSQSESANQRFLARNGVPFHLPPSCVLSPDHKWLLCLPGGSSRTFKAVALDDNTEVKWQSAADEVTSDPTWLPDSHRWIAYNSRAFAAFAGFIEWSSSGYVMRDLDDPKHRDKREFEHSMPPQRKIGITQDDRILSFDNSPGSTGHGDDSVRMANCILTRTPSPLSPYTVTIKLPMPSDCREIVISTKRDRLAWLLGYDMTSPLETFLHRIIPGFHSRPKPALGIWVSALDGSHMVEIGHVPILGDSLDDQTATNIQWVPGDTRLSLLHYGALYTVPVP